MTVHAESDCFTVSEDILYSPQVGYEVLSNGWRSPQWLRVYEISTYSGFQAYTAWSINNVGFTSTPETSGVAEVTYRLSNSSGVILGSGSIQYIIEDVDSCPCGGDAYYVTIMLTASGWTIPDGITGSQKIYLDYNSSKLYGIRRCTSTRIYDNGYGNSNDDMTLVNVDGYLCVDQGSGVTKNQSASIHIDWENCYEATDSTLNTVSVIKKGDRSIWRITDYTGVLDVGDTDFNSDDFSFQTPLQPLYLNVTTPWGHNFRETILPVTSPMMVGTCYNASDGSVIPNVVVTTLSNGIWRNDTSDASGNYSIANLPRSTTILVNASANGYNFLPFTTTFYENLVYDVDIYMFPTSISGYSQSAIGGIVYGKPYSQAVEGATVNIWNGTWSDSTTTTSTGYYFFDGLTNGTYTLNVTKNNYDTSNDESVTVGVSDFEQKDFLINPNLDLTVTVKDVETLGLITNGTVVVGTTEQPIVAGKATFTDLDPGSYEVSAQSEGYYPGVVNVVVDDFGETATIYLTSSEGVVDTGVGAQYPSHLVEIKIVDIYGNPLKNVNITAVGVETSGSWSWLSSIFGFENVTEIRNTTMEGATGDTGSVSFMMVETIKYHLLFQNASQGINETTAIYPKEEQYIFVVPTTPAVEIGDVTSWNLSVNEVNSTHAYLNLSYVDELNETQNVTFYVFNASRVEIYNETFVDQSNVNASYLVTTEHNTSYFWGFVAKGHYGTHEEYKFIRFTAGRLIDLGLKNESYYSWISIALLFFVSLLFSVTTAKFGYVTIPLMSAFFWWIGWLQVSSVIILSALALGVLLYIGKKEREEGL